MILDGKKIALELKEELKIKINKLNIKPELTVILVGDNKASKQYINNKKKYANDIGIKCNIIELEENIEEKILIEEINKLNKNKNINGIIIQLPLPKNLNNENILNTIDSCKDIDGFHPYNLGKMFRGDYSGLLPCTPKGILKIFDKYNINLEGKDVCVIGRSNIVGKPISILCLERGATVTTCHSKTKDLKQYTKNSDIIISAVGLPNLIKSDMITPNSILIDVGCSYYEEDGIKKFSGDMDFKNLEKNNKITPVPGGIGPLTVISIFENTYSAYLNQNNKVLD